MACKERAEDSSAGNRGVSVSSNVTGECASQGFRGRLGCASYWGWGVGSLHMLTSPVSQVQAFNKISNITLTE